MSFVDLFAFPLSVILAIVLCLGIVLCFICLKDRQVAKGLAGGSFAAFLLGCIAIYLAIEGTWPVKLHRSAVFLILVTFLLLGLGLYLLYAFQRKNLSKVMFAEHLGFFIIALSMFFSAPDFRNCVIVAYPGQEYNIALDDKGLKTPLPFTLELQEFKIDYHKDGTSPKQYSSLLKIDGLSKTTSVNHPCLHKGWLIYQSDYDSAHGRFSVLRLIRDPWLPVTFLGMAILAAAALLEIKKVWQSKAVLPIVIGLAVIFGIISVAKINFGTLMPALRSFWFIPHLIIYMLAYSLLAIALVLSITALAKKSRPESSEKLYGASCRLLETSSSLLIIGMLCGAVWAKSAWGDYWTWDAKECWAAATWMLTLAGLHLPKSNKKLIIALITILLSFAAMQITWYGVNALPAAKESMHTYNKS